MCSLLSRLGLANDSVRSLGSKLAHAALGALDEIQMQAVCDDGDLCDEIAFTTAGAVGVDDIPWQDRPTFQQIVEVQGHRPR